MKNIVTFDFGTTAVKCVVVSPLKDVVFSGEIAISTNNDFGLKTQNPQDWWDAFCNLSAQYLQIAENSEVEGLIFSGQMQDVILVDKKGESVFPAILYSDQCGGEFFGEIPSEIVEIIEKKSGNKLDGTIPLLKLLWLRKYHPEILKKAHKMLISSKDFVITKLTGEFVSDFTALSTGGIFDLDTKQYISEVSALGIDLSIFPTACKSAEVAGTITKDASLLCGFSVGTKVYAGIGDAGATTLASGIADVGEININLGTSGWVASISDKTSKSAFNLVDVSGERMINVVPILNAGVVHKWIASTIFGGVDKYDRVRDALKNTNPCSGGLLFLPYILGERFPVADGNVRGCFIGAGVETSKDDFVRSALEGVAFSIKQGLLALGISPKKVSIIGGGSREEGWNQIFADVLGVDILVFENAEFLPSMALCSAVMLENQVISGYAQFSSEFETTAGGKIYPANKDVSERYQTAFERFLKVYNSVKPLF